MPTASPAPDPQLALYQALAAFQGEAAGVPKDARNSHFHKGYATLAAVIEAVRPATVHGLSHSQTFEQTAGGGTLLVTTIHHVAGASIRSTLPIGFGADWQRNGSAITYARRYSLLAAYGLAPDDDDDGNSAAPAPSRQATPNDDGAPPRDDRAIAVATARKALRAAGLTREGAQAMLAELAPPGVHRLDDLPLAILKRLGHQGASDAEISRWNSASEPASDANEEQDHPPLADPAVLAELAGAA